MMNKFFLISILAFGLDLNGQTPDPQRNDVRILDAKESYTIIGDKRIKELENRFIEINKENPEIAGYRIQLFSSSGASSWDQANTVQADFLKIYPDIPAYVIHKKPSFKVRIGDYRTRLEAERFFIELKENFPDAFIVNDLIALPKLSIEE